MSHLSHEKWERFASYSVGWLNFLGWIGGITGISLLLTSVLEDIILLWHPGYPSTLWTSTLITIAIICASVGLNSYGARIVSAVEIIAFFIHIFGLMAVVIILL